MAILWMKIGCNAIKEAGKLRVMLDTSLTLKKDLGTDILTMETSFYRKTLHYLWRFILLNLFRHAFREKTPCSLEQKWFLGLSS